MSDARSPAAEGNRRRGLTLAATGETARLCAWICGLCLAALICLFFGDALYALTLGGTQ